MPSRELPESEAPPESRALSRFKTNVAAATRYIGWVWPTLPVRFRETLRPSRVAIATLTVDPTDKSMVTSAFIDAGWTVRRDDPAQRTVQVMRRLVTESESDVEAAAMEVLESRGLQASAARFSLTRPDWSRWDRRSGRRWSLVVDAPIEKPAKRRGWGYSLTIVGSALAGVVFSAWLLSLGWAALLACVVLATAFVARLWMLAAAAPGPVTTSPSDAARRSHQIDIALRSKGSSTVTDAGVVAALGVVVGQFIRMGIEPQRRQGAASGTNWFDLVSMLPTAMVAIVMGLGAVTLAWLCLPVNPPRVRWRRWIAPPLLVGFVLICGGLRMWFFLDGAGLPRSHALDLRIELLVLGVRLAAVVGGVSGVLLVVSATVPMRFARVGVMMLGAVLAVVTIPALLAGDRHAGLTLTRGAVYGEISEHVARCLSFEGVDPPIAGLTAAIEVDAGSGRSWLFSPATDSSISSVTDNSVLVYVVDSGDVAGQVIPCTLVGPAGSDTR